MIILYWKILFAPTSNMVGYNVHGVRFEKVKHPPSQSGAAPQRTRRPAPGETGPSARTRREPRPIENLCRQLCCNHQ